MAKKQTLLQQAQAIHKGGNFPRLTYEHGEATVVSAGSNLSIDDLWGVTMERTRYTRSNMVADKIRAGFVGGASAYLSYAGFGQLREAYNYYAHGTVSSDVHQKISQKIHSECLNNVLTPSQVKAEIGSCESQRDIQADYQTQAAATSFTGGVGLIVGALVLGYLCSGLWRKASDDREVSQAHDFIVAEANKRIGDNNKNMPSPS